MYQRILFKSQGYLTYHHFGAQPSFGDLSCWANFGTYMSFVGGIKFVMMLEPFQRCWGNFSSLQTLKFSYKNCYYLPTKQEVRSLSM